MERLRQKVESAQKALKTLAELLGSPSPTVIERDAAIQRLSIPSKLSGKQAKPF